MKSNHTTSTRIYLCGHTGSANRGCEAIVRSTVRILKECGAGNITLFTFDPDYDRKLGLQKTVELTAYPQKSAAVRAVSYLRRRFFGDGVWGQKYLYDKLLKAAQPSSVSFCIGGDTYCYDPPYGNYALNNVAREKGIPNVLWGCSVDERILHDGQMLADIRKYRHIVARESMSHHILSQCVAPDQKIHLACDPAFHLIPEQTPLPDGFLPGNTVGINMSPLVLRDKGDPDDMMYRNVRCLIHHILEDSQMNVCLIPHVYDYDRGTQDLAVLRRIKSWFKEEPRVCIAEGELSCTRLKYIISQCRFFIGARTHATIAAYSTAVPALALSYSIKSLGIAQDLFGSSEEFAIPWKTIREENFLCDAFERTLVGREQQLRQRYSQILPEYIHSIISVTGEILNSEAAL